MWLYWVIYTILNLSAVSHLKKLIYLWLLAFTPLISFVTVRHWFHMETIIIELLLCHLFLFSPQLIAKSFLPVIIFSIPLPVDLLLLWQRYSFVNLIHRLPFIFSSTQSSDSDGTCCGLKVYVCYNFIENVKSLLLIRECYGVICVICFHDQRASHLDQILLGLGDL